MGDVRRLTKFISITTKDFEDVILISSTGRDTITKNGLSQIISDLSNIYHNLHSKYPEIAEPEEFNDKPYVLGPE